MTKRPPRSTKDSAAWRAYWQARGMPWRTEPEPDDVRRRFLADRRAVPPDIRQGIYPFTGVKLSRSDVEWLLATHRGESGETGPVHLRPDNEWRPDGIDLRGADLSQTDLSNLPLTRLLGSLRYFEWANASTDQREAAAVHMEGCQLRETHFEEANLRSAHFEAAVLFDAHMRGARLHGAHFEGARLVNADLEEARLQGVALTGKRLEEPIPPWALGVARGNPPELPPADLHGVLFNTRTRLEGVILCEGALGCPILAEVQWGGVNVTGIDWSHVDKLSEELRAREGEPHNWEEERAQARTVVTHSWEVAIRAYRQLTTLLRSQGLNEDADRFAYRAQVIDRIALRRQGRLGAWLVSVGLWALAGYGYRLWRIFAAYAIAVALFAVGYLIAATVGSQEHMPTARMILNATQTSLNAIHGRVFFTQFGLDTLQSWLATVESIVGIVIEGVFVAMLIQRFFGR